MTKTLAHHQQEVLQKENRVNELRQSIGENERKLPELRNTYQKAVAEDGDNIDALFQDIESLEQQLKADKYKLKTLETVTQDHLRHSAVDVIVGFPSVKAEYKGKADKVFSKIQAERKRHEEAMNGLKQEIAAINDDFEDEANLYWDLIEKNGIAGRLERPQTIARDTQAEEAHAAAEEQARKEGKIIPNQLHSDIKRSAEGLSKVFNLVQEEANVKWN